MTNNKTPQNISHLISEIGESMVLFKLYTLIHDNPKFEIYKNYSDSGYDIGLRNIENGSKIKIEVKTRQHLITTSKKNNRTCHFTLTENEQLNADFLIGYWLDYNDFFITPISDLKQTKSRNKTLYKLVFSRLRESPDLKKNSYSPSVSSYLNNWNLISQMIEQ